MTIQLDATTATGIVLIIGAIVEGIRRIIREIRSVGQSLATNVASNDAKLDDIKATTEQSAKNVDGNLTAVREQLALSTAENKALHQTVTALSSALSASKTAEAISASRRATDKPPVPSADSADITGT